MPCPTERCQEVSPAVSVVSAFGVCTWCVGDLRPLDGAPTVSVCTFCGRAISFHVEARPSRSRSLEPCSARYDAAAEANPAPRRLTFWTTPLKQCSVRASRRASCDSTLRAGCSC
jgi:hypothetical protein